MCTKTAAGCGRIPAAALHPAPPRGNVQVLIPPLEQPSEGGQHRVPEPLPMPPGFPACVGDKNTPACLHVEPCSCNAPPGPWHADPPVYICAVYNAGADGNPVNVCLLCPPRLTLPACLALLCGAYPTRLLPARLPRACCPAACLQAVYARPGTLVQHGTSPCFATAPFSCSMALRYACWPHTTAAQQPMGPVQPSRTLALVSWLLSPAQYKLELATQWNYTGLAGEELTAAEELYKRWARVCPCSRWPHGQCLTHS